MLAAVLPAACGPKVETNADVFERYRPQIVAKKADLTQILEQLPGMASKPASGAVKPSYIYRNGMISFPTNVAIIEAESFKGGDLPDVYLEKSSALDKAFEWLDFSIGYSPEGRASDYQLAEQIEEAMATPYVAFYRQIAYVPPEFTANDTYKPGGVRIEIVLVDLAQRAPIASCDVGAVSSQELSYSSTKRMDDVSSRSALRRDLAANALNEIAACLNEQTGGEFVFERDSI